MDQKIRSIKDLPPYISVQQLADLLSVSRAMAYQLVHSSGFPVVRLGERRIVCPRDELEKWLKDRETIGV